ncbi:MAG: type II secretion system protein [Candidatus Rifleibacteriota bacterium]
MAITEKTGLTLIELVVCTLIIGVLSATALPLSKNFVRNEKERLLRERLATVRKAIDRFYQKNSGENSGLEDYEYYPKSLNELVENRFLRKIPVDPITGKTNWSVRSSTDEIGKQITNGVNVFDIVSSSEKVGSNDVPYNKW